MTNVIIIVHIVIMMYYITLWYFLNLEQSWHYKGHVLRPTSSAEHKAAQSYKTRKSP